VYDSTEIGPGAPDEGSAATLGADVARLRTLRRRRGWTQVQLAAAAGVGAVTIARLETGVQTPRPSTMARIARALGVKITDVDEFRDQESPPPR
jgi:transcriptional regulator with XRE-family HTH domain